MKLQTDAQQVAATEGENTEEANMNDDEEMGCEGDGAKPEKSKTASRRQNEKLYGEEGMLNTKLKKAEKKKMKKNNKSAMMEDDVIMDGDYDFKVDYVKKNTAMDLGEEEDGKAEDISKNRFELPSGVDLENEQ